MTSTIGRFYAIAIGVVVFFVSWAVIAAKPWASANASTKTDARLSQLQAREIQLQARALAVQKILNARWGPYRTALATRLNQMTAQQQLQLAGAPAGPSVIVKVLYTQGSGVQTATTTRTSPLP